MEWAESAVGSGGFKKFSVVGTFGLVSITALYRDCVVFWGYLLMARLGYYLFVEGREVLWGMFWCGFGMGIIFAGGVCVFLMIFY